MRSRLFIIGDSFACASQDGSFYGNFLQDNFPEIDIIPIGRPSRDVQSIIDDWIKLLPILKKNDYLIVAIPTFDRTRFALAENSWTDMDNYNRISFKNRFIGTGGLVADACELDFFGKNYDKNYFDSLMVTQKIINSSKASEFNYFEIINSLKKMTQSKNYIFSWAEFENNEVPFDDYHRLKKKMGIWKTLNDAFLESNGPKKWEYDTHWHKVTHMAFAEMIKKEFNLETIKE